ncbi:MAG: NAD(+) diphosphatase [Sphingomonadales bacterium]|nr:NAD(+) diphosphatase [Sphingomonadales bacterium]
MRAIAFSGGTLDRADGLREDAAALAALVADGKLLEMEGIAPLLDERGGLCWGAAGAGAEAAFLGRDHAGRGHFAPIPAADAANVAPPDARLWQAMARIAPEELALYGLARSLAGWHARHRFCAVCGSPTRLARGGWQRDCSGATCGAAHFPRVDPVVIMTVEHDDALLLGRQPRFPPQRYSALAGFVEPGESLEEAVAREVFEEAGVEVGAVRYVASQPWPFPSSLMIGCEARARGRELRIDAKELEDARWFTRAEVRAAMRGEPDAPFLPPPPHAIAWHLLDRWLAGG